MKTTNTLMLGLVILALNACSGANGGGGGDPVDLETRLSGESFELQGMAAALSSISADCSDGTPNTEQDMSGTNGYGTSSDADVDTFGFSGALTWSPPNSRQLSPAPTQTIIFSTSGTFAIWENGRPTYNGQWDAIDSNTVEVTMNGGEYRMDVSFVGDILKVTHSDTENCGLSGETTPTTSLDENSESAAWKPYQGTWCYESGNPMTVALVVDTQGQLYQADLMENHRFYKGQTTQLEFTDPDLNLNDWHGTYAFFPNVPYTSDQTGYNVQTALSFTDTTQQKLKLRYGINKEAILSKTSATDTGECPNLTLGASTVEGLLSDLNESEESFFRLLENGN